MSNVASRTYKKRGFCSFGAQFAPPIAFELHRWHLPLRLGVTTGKTTTSDPKLEPPYFTFYIFVRSNSKDWLKGHVMACGISMWQNKNRSAKAIWFKLAARFLWPLSFLVKAEVVIASLCSLQLIER